MKLVERMNEEKHKTEKTKDIGGVLQFSKTYLLKMVLLEKLAKALAKLVERKSKLPRMADNKKQTRNR